MVMKKDRLEYEFLPEALEIEETPPSPLGRILLMVHCPPDRGGFSVELFWKGG